VEQGSFGFSEERTISTFAWHPTHTTLEICLLPFFPSLEESVRKVEHPNEPLSVREGHVVNCREKRGNEERLCTEIAR